MVLAGLVTLSTEQVRAVQSGEGGGIVACYVATMCALWRVVEDRYASLNGRDTFIHSEKLVVRRFRRRAIVIECTYTNLDSTV